MKFKFGVSAVFIGALALGAHVAGRGPVSHSFEQSSEAVTDCGELQDRMELNLTDVDQNATCTVRTRTADGRVLTKTFRARVALQSRRAVGQKEATQTAALVIDETCETCRNGPQQHVRSLDSIKDIRDWALARAREEVEVADRNEQIDGCAVTADGTPGPTQPVEILSCRIGQVTGRDPEADRRYFRKWLAPNLAHLILSQNPGERALGARALTTLQQRISQNPVIMKTVSMLAQHVYYADKLQQMDAYATRLTGQPAERAKQLAEMDLLRKKWSYNYEEHRRSLTPAVPEGAEMIALAKELEGNLNASVAKYDRELPATPGAPGEGRTAFGQPGGPTRSLPTAPGVARPAVPGGVAQPGVPAGAAPGAVDSRIFRTR